MNIKHNTLGIWGWLQPLVTFSNSFTLTYFNITCVTTQSEMSDEWL